MATTYDADPNLCHCCLECGGIMEYADAQELELVCERCGGTVPAEAETPCACPACTQNGTPWPIEVGCAAG